MPTDIVTTDLFIVAYLLCNGVKYSGLMNESKKNKKQKIVFIFPRTKKVSDLIEKFKYEEAVGNIVQLKKNFLYARDLMYSELRNKA